MNQSPWKASRKLLYVLGPISFESQFLISEIDIKILPVFHVFLLTQSCPAFCNLLDCRLPGSCDSLLGTWVKPDNQQGATISWASQMALVVKNLPANVGDVRHRFDPWAGKIPWRRKWQPTLAWKIPWMEEPNRLQSVGLQRDRTERLHFHFHFTPK